MAGLFPFIQTSMKLISAIIRPEMLSEVKAALCRAVTADAVQRKALEASFQKK
jgi:nitrogen regulatory protein PII